MASIKQKSPGVWKARYRAPDPAKGGAMVERSFTVKADSKREAQAIADERELDERRVQISADATSSVADFLVHWANNRPDTYKGKRPAPKTIARDKQHVEVINRHVGSVRMREVSAKTFDKLVQGLRADGLAPRTIKNTRAVLKKALRQAWRDDVIRDDPSAKAIAPHVPRTEAAFATFEDVDAITDHLEGCMDRFDLAVYVRLLFFTGCRPGEVIAITWDDIDLNAGTLNINKVASGAGDDYLVRHETKTEGSTAVLALPDPAIADLERLRKAYLAAKGDKGLGWNPEGYVWPGADGLLPIRPTSLARKVRVAIRAVGLSLTLYSFRHGSGTYMLEQGASIKEVQDHLRHSTAQLTTDTYLHVTDRLKERKVSMFNKLR
ncbi:tyrosine-type recombinase/integrase [Ruegeria sp. HKCCD6228]|uniref:tyrosine-type recombinase/integrase n=1 Tax=unclassified Ruegeria TaxID=2625375 RepID=UPI001489714B|nr:MULTISPECIES: site-specific integrase [unclassified Ruegeria]NOD96998.1 tyrosine-type recombinase/integrase [Ruegeria sp. HKCCD6228]